MKLMQKKINYNDSKILYNKAVSEEMLTQDFDIKTGSWSVQDGWIIGKNPLNNPGMIVSKADYFGNIMLEFTAATILPCTHDINAMWNGSWDDETNTRGLAYVAGLQGWWNGKVGFEKSPEYKLKAGTPLFGFEPGKEYHILMGSIDGHAFVFADGKLLLEAFDPDPIDNTKYGKIGFEAYCAQIRVKDICVRQIAYEDVPEKYEPEF